MAVKKWVIIHPCGRCLPDTAADDPFTPVAILCGALEPHDWDAFKDQGYRLDERTVRTIRKEAANVVEVPHD